MNAIKIETTVDEATARVIPGLRPLLGKRVELIALQAEGQPGEAPAGKFTTEQLFAAAVKPTPGSPPLTDDDIERAIIAGALRGNV